jgi:hypothetical protein
MLGNIISQLYRIADLLKTKKLVDKDSNTDNNNDSEDKPKEITLDDIYQYYKSQLEVEFSYDIQNNNIEPFPETFDDIESSNSEIVNETGIYKCNGVYGTVLFSYIITGQVNIRNYVCFILSNK